MAGHVFVCIGIPSAELFQSAETFCFMGGFAVFTDDILVRVRGGMSLRNGMWNDVRNGIIMQNMSCGMTQLCEIRFMHNDSQKYIKLKKCAFFWAPICKYSLFVTISTEECITKTQTMVSSNSNFFPSILIA